jgi:hypothetical protein
MKYSQSDGQSFTHLALPQPYEVGVTHLHFIDEVIDG